MKRSRVSSLFLPLIVTWKHLAQTASSIHATHVVRHANDFRYFPSLSLSFSHFLSLCFSFSHPLLHSVRPPSHLHLAVFDARCYVSLSAFLVLLSLVHFLFSSCVWCLFYRTNCVNERTRGIHHSLIALSFPLSMCVFFAFSLLVFLLERIE